jgi:hypothetical protein
MRDDGPAFKCSVCRRRFRSYGSLKSHLGEHSRPRQCHNCGKVLRESEYHRC